jgi:RND superfamily putative drug exporter
MFGFPALDNTAPLFAFLFLVALGVDYTIFLVTRAREETPAPRARGRASSGRFVGHRAVIIGAQGIVPCRGVLRASVCGPG